MSTDRCPKITTAGSVKLGVWMTQNADKIPALSADTIAERAAKDIGIPQLATRAVRVVAKAMGLKLRKNGSGAPGKSRRPGTGGYGAIQYLRKEVAALTARLTVLEEAIRIWNTNGQATQGTTEDRWVPVDSRPITAVRDFSRPACRQGGVPFAEGVLQG